jgi:anti-sigma factor RsiW
MALADGELEEPRKGEVERWLAARPDQQQRQRRRESFHRLVGESAKTHLGPSSIPDLTGSILAAVEREAAGRETAPTQSGPRPRQRSPQVVALGGWLTSRKLLGAVAFGTAAAAALALWLRPAAPPEPARPVLIASSRLPVPDVAEDDAVVGDDSTTITSIDLGSQSGAVFYVRGQTTASAVLWIDDTPPSPSSP